MNQFEDEIEKRVYETTIDEFTIYQAYAKHFLRYLESQLTFEINLQLQNGKGVNEITLTLPNKQQFRLSIDDYHTPFHKSKIHLDYLSIERFSKLFNGVRGKRVATPIEEFYLEQFIQSEYKKFVEQKLESGEWTWESVMQYAVKNKVKKIRNNEL